MDRVNSFLHKRTLIVGDVKTGKTATTTQILQEFLMTGYANRIAVLDLAPEAIEGIGGKMEPPPEPGLLYLTASICAPRLTGKNERQVFEMARQNARTIETLFAKLQQQPRDIVFVNDASLFLQAGDLDVFIRALGTASTQIVNAYYGKRFSDSALTLRERQRLEAFMKTCDNIIALD